MRSFVFLLVLFFRCDVYAIDSKEFANANNSSPWNQQKDLNGVWITDIEKIQKWANEYLNIRKSAKWKLEAITETVEYFGYENGKTCSSSGVESNGEIAGEAGEISLLASNINGVVVQNIEERELVSMFVFESPESFYISHLEVLEFGITGARQYFKKVDNRVKVKWRGGDCSFIQ